MAGLIRGFCQFWQRDEDQDKLILRAKNDLAIIAGLKRQCLMWWKGPSTGFALWVGDRFAGARRLFIHCSGGAGEGPDMARKSLPPIGLALGVLICALGAPPVRAQAPAAVKSVCLATGETREEIKIHHLLEPFVVLKSAEKTVGKAEALSAKLCRLGEDYVYEIALLHRDGRLVHVVMSAVTGKPMTTRISREASPRT
jgi:hypothetical protein